ncbi:hypothetical protein EVAR_51171_1 [Eumeta japonica]|uniref:Uncharacterized protein n=1 Tax=Eumeta variegata TaxID=151549 RepID=A0A4C1XFF6_EUMVA|nr:hypothetical protein EVAR_51171_1 [Eumeta japonica]
MQIALGIVNLTTGNPYGKRELESDLARNCLRETEMAAEIAAGAMAHADGSAYFPTARRLRHNFLQNAGLRLLPYK